MLSPRIHGLDHFRSLNRFTARHDWRMVETGMVFQVAGGATFQTIAILPKDERHGRYRAQILIRRMGTNQTFAEPLDRFWDQLDRNVFGSSYSNLFVRWEPMWVKKSIERHARKVARERARVRRFLVVNGLIVVEGGAA